MAQRRVKELEQQLVNKTQGNEKERSDHQPRNSTAVSSSGRDNLRNNTNHPKEMEIDDILQIISTTMATLKSFESRYKKQGNSQMTHSDEW